MKAHLASQAQGFQKGPCQQPWLLLLAQCCRSPIQQLEEEPGWLGHNTGMLLKAGACEVQPIIWVPRHAKAIVPHQLKVALVCAVRDADWGVLEDRGAGPKLKDALTGTKGVNCIGLEGMIGEVCMGDHEGQLCVIHLHTDAHCNSQAVCS